ncbi:Rid family hydrolase [Nocardioides sp. C4-1]|uniref:Rid family hydrolase n=1 Tax=Nocardioides sp. C4-1 TaxID=3151851 RepID=UPI003263F8D9
MTTAQFSHPAGLGDFQRTEMHYEQAVRIGDVVHISGQGGWDDQVRFPADLTDEIVRAFDNVEKVLATAGATWRDVVAVDSFHVPTAADEIGDEHTRVMIEQMRRRMGDRAPVWTEIGVPALGAVGMRVEIKVTAVVPPSA